MAIESHEETPAILALRRRLVELDNVQRSLKDDRETYRTRLDDTNEHLVKTAGEIDSVENALKTLVREATQAALLQGTISQQAAVDRLGGIL